MITLILLNVRVTNINKHIFKIFSFVRQKSLDKALIKRHQ